jgi:hypothetical protein
MRTTPTPAPLADKPSASAALNVASPHTVGGNVLRIPNPSGLEHFWSAKEAGETLGAFKGDPV